MSAKPFTQGSYNNRPLSERCYIHDSVPRSRLVLDLRYIFTGACVDLDRFALIDKSGT